MVSNIDTRNLSSTVVANTSAHQISLLVFVLDISFQKSVKVVSCWMNTPQFESRPRGINEGKCDEGFLSLYACLGWKNIYVCMKIIEGCSSQLWYNKTTKVHSFLWSFIRETLSSGPKTWKMIFFYVQAPCYFRILLELWFQVQGSKI